MRTRTLSRLLIGVALIALLLSGGGLVYLRLNPPATATPAPTATPMAVDLIFVAAQDIPPGTVIREEMVEPWRWPRDIVPPGAIYDPTRIYGRMSRVTILKGQVILPGMLAEPGQVAGTGSLAASLLHPGEVAVAYPLTALSSVAHGVSDGDTVDLVLTLLLSDLDVDFQSKLPNQLLILVQDQETGEYRFVPVGSVGRMEEEPVLEVPVYVIPAEDQRPRMVTQMTLRNVRVLHVGLWQEVAAPTPEAQPTPVGAPPATPTPGLQDVITVAVSPQEAVVLNFLLAMGARTSFALRARGDAAVPGTQPVTLDYIMENFGIPVPMKLPYGLPGPTQTAPTATPIPPTPFD